MPELLRESLGCCCKSSSFIELCLCDSRQAACLDEVDEVDFWRCSWTLSSARGTSSGSVLASSGCPFLVNTESSDVTGEVIGRCPVRFGVEEKAYTGTFGVDTNPLPLKLVEESRCFKRLF